MRQLYFERVSPIFIRPNGAGELPLLRSGEHSNLLAAAKGIGGLLLLTSIASFDFGMC